MRNRLFHNTRVLAGVFLFLFLCLSSPARAGEIPPRAAARIEAAFLVRFCRYVSWPLAAFPAADTPITIGILGADPFGSAINQAARNFRTRGRHIEIIRLQKPEDSLRCHILFITPEQAVNLARIHEILRQRPVLLVSDMDNFLEWGGMIRFIFINNKLRFEINLANCRKKDLEISSKLLQIAHRVVK